VADVRLRALADADLADILDYGISEFGETIGTDYVRSFEQAFALLGRHPFAGALNNDVVPPIHCLHHRRHRIFYDVEGETVWIVRVLHHAMDIPARLAR
jgi:toxin ParE1/3/4